MRELTASWNELQAFARQPVRAPAGLSARIMAEVRARAARLGAGAMLTGLRGDTRISAMVLAKIARRAALGVPGVALASAMRVVADPVDRRRVRLSLRLVVTFGPALAPLASLVRDEIRSRVHAQAGVEVSGIDIAIDDLISDL